jgi:hypothetical protein
VALLIAWLSSFLPEPWPDLGKYASIAVIAASFALITWLVIELQGRANDKFYNMYTRKKLSREYREDDR